MMVLLRKRDPDFVDALDTDTEKWFLAQLRERGQVMRFRVNAAGNGCQEQMLDGLTPMTREGESLEREFRCLGEDIPRAAAQHRSTQPRNKQWQQP